MKNYCCFTKNQILSCLEKFKQYIIDNDFESLKVTFNAYKSNGEEWHPGIDYRRNRDPYFTKQFHGHEYTFLDSSGLESRPIQLEQEDE